MLKKAEVIYKPNINLGVLGGGQLGKMLGQAAAELDIRLHVLDPTPNPPSEGITFSQTLGNFRDYETVLAFGKDKDVLTVEIEDVNTQALKELNKQGVKIFPHPEALELIKNKRRQKELFTKLGLPTSAYFVTYNIKEVEAQKGFLPAFHKLAEAGYDGRGVTLLKNENDFPKAFDTEAVLEKLVDIEKEFSVIGARNLNGEMALFPLVEQVFHPEKHVLQYLISPANLEESIENAACEMVKQLLESLEYVGLMAVEFFLTKDGQVLINEIAPRPHNSGHHTIRANVTSQFMQHLRAILNLPLGLTNSYCPAGIVNLLGEEGYTGKVKYEGMEKALSLPGVFPYLYGKAETKPFRKMGHVTIVAPTLPQVKKLAEEVSASLRVISE